MTYSANLATTIKHIERHVVDKRMTKAKAERINRLKRHLNMAMPVVTTDDHNIEDSMVTYNVFSIDAVRDENGWSWNDKFKMDDFQVQLDDTTVSNSRKLLKLCREQGWLTEQSKGKVKVDYVNGDNEIIEVINKNTCQLPLG